MTDSFAHIASFYDARVEEFGHDPRACDYSGPGPQATKFRVVSEVTPLAGLSVLDVGCGFADWADYLEARDLGVGYTGIDLSAKMIGQARRRRPDLDLRIGNVLDGDVGSFDVVAANGIFYLLGDEAPSLMQSIVESMFAACRVATVFTTLSSWSESRDPGEYYADPGHMTAWCRTLTPWVVLRHDYHRRDFALYLYREPRF